MKVMIVAAGTGGHVFPGLAVAQVLRSQHICVEWLGTAQGKARDWVKPHAIPYHAIAMQGLRGKGLFGWLLAPLRLLRATFQAWMILRQQKPSVVLVMGGYVSAPAGIAARLLGIPLWLHEQNAVAGLSNRLLAPLSNRILLGLPLVTCPWGWKNAVVVGNPLRANLQRQVKTVANKPLRLLILGGSQGAHFLNTCLPEVMRAWPLAQNITIWHQTGQREQKLVHDAYEQSGLSARVDAFIEDMGQAYAWADLVIARAGALTVAELMQVARPALLIPYPHAVDDHQAANAKALLVKGAAQMLLQHDADVAKVRAVLQDYLQDTSTLELAYSQATQVGENKAAEVLANELIATFAKRSEEGEKI